MAGEQRFDNAIRDLVAGAPVSLCRWLTGEAVTSVRAGPARLPAVPIEADGVFVVDESALLHVEFELRAQPARIHARLVDYWVRLQRSEGVAPVQHVVVLAPGSRLPGTYRHGGLRLDYHVHHLWEIPASVLLDVGGLSPLAVLAAPAVGASRVDLLETVLRRIRDEPDASRRRDLAQHAATLANLHVPRSTLELIFRRWTDMAVDLRELPMFREAFAEGLAEGRDAERTALVLRQLRRRFGELGAERSALIGALDAQRGNELVDAVLEFASLDELDRWLAT